MHTVNHIRSAFLDFFKEKGHTVVPSAPLIPHNDPTLMFVNAGMVPFKDVFTGHTTLPYTQAASSQKCVRAGGKHNDLDNVGYTARHHTFFEMLGNFSFGEYFKEKAILYAWEFLTKIVEIPEEKLMVTVYHTDDEAFAFWKKIASLPEHRIIRIATNDNFWAMGETGPCGPCSEIFYDHGPGIAGGPPGSEDADGDRFVEIWNLVFMQFDQQSPGERVQLPAPSIDTGMGLERLATVLQGVHDNYAIDLFVHLIKASQELSGNKNKASQASHRVIADHIRACSFLLADGVMPSNEGRGYVLRRIMRRAMRHAYQLGCAGPLLYRLVPVLVEEMGNAYPELERAEALITEMLKLEEERFRVTLGRGLKLLEEESQKFEKGSKLSGDVAFKLYDTYGFPLDLTKDILRTQHKEVDEAGFNKAMAVQKEMARAAWKGSGEKATDVLWLDIRERVGVTEFLGYKTEHAQAQVVALVKGQQEVKEAGKGEEVYIILNQTPFYGVSGGQEGDFGTLAAKHIKVAVEDTQKLLDGLFIHKAKILEGVVRIGSQVEANVTNIRRSRLRANHSATHILHAVLREILGTHVTQKGSLVAEDRLRFDFSHPKSLGREELMAIEQKVNAVIRQNSEVGTRIMAPEEAIKAGALALFGEKYGDEVRVVNMGVNESSMDYSVELCGGTHVQRTGDIGFFKITSESAIAAGVRRIEAVTGEEAVRVAEKYELLLWDIASQVKVAPEELGARIHSLLEERKKLEKEIKEYKKKAAMGGGYDGQGQQDRVESLQGVAYVGKHYGEMEPRHLRDIASELKNQLGSGIAVVASTWEGKGSLIIAVTPDITPKVSAVELIKEASDILGAKGGGGKPDFAQTGGPHGDKVEEVLAHVKASVQKKLS